MDYFINHNDGVYNKWDDIGCFNNSPHDVLFNVYKPIFVHDSVYFRDDDIELYKCKQLARINSYRATALHLQLTDTAVAYDDAIKRSDMLDKFGFYISASLLTHTDILWDRLVAIESAIKALE